MRSDSAIPAGVKKLTRQRKREDPAAETRGIYGFGEPGCGKQTAYWQAGTSMSPHPEPSAEVLQSFSDISVVVEAHFEEQMMDVHEVLAIRPGSVIPMKRAAGETLNVYVGNVYLATAEVIVIEDHLALRITQFGKFEA